MNASRVAVTWFRSVHDAPPLGRRRAATVTELAAWWTSRPAAPTSDKKSLPVWCPATFRGDRRALANVERVTALAFDFDGVRPTTRSVLGAPLDAKARDASRAWFVPCALPDYDAHAELAREVLDVDQGLTIAPRGEAERERADRCARPERRPQAQSRPSTSTLERASRYLASLPPAIEGSGGSNATIRAAVALVRGFALDPAIAFELLSREYNPRCKPPWSARDLARKVNEAAKATRVGLGYLLNERPST